MGVTEPTDVSDSNRPVEPKERFTVPELPAPASPSPVPPAGLPLAPSPVTADPGAGQTTLVTPWYDPRPFILRNATTILRLLAVIAAIALLLLLWQEVAEGSDTADRRPPAPPPPAPVFDEEKFAHFLEEEQASGTAGSASLGPVTGESAPQSATPAVTPPRGVDGESAESTPAEPLSSIPTPELAWHDGFSLALSLEVEFAETEPSDGFQLRSELHGWLLEFTRLAGPGDNPLERMNALSELMTRGLRLTVSDDHSLETLLPARILEGRRASSLGWCVIALAFADRIRDLELEPVLCAGEIALRYQNGAHRYVLSPAAPDRVLTDREFARLVGGGAGGASDGLQNPVPEVLALTRPEFWGRVLTLGGIDRIAAGAWPRGMELLHRGLDLDPRQPAARVALARAHLERGERARALECLSLATELDPNDRAARRARVDLLLELGEFGAAADDLALLASGTALPEDIIRYSKWWLERGEFRRAHETLGPLLERKLDEEIARSVRAIASEIEAAPWVALLRSRGDDRARLHAVRRLITHPGPQSEEALIGVLNDRNGRLSSTALATLREMTGVVGIPRDPERWRQALAGRRRHP